MSFLIFVVVVVVLDFFFTLSVTFATLFFTLSVNLWLLTKPILQKKMVVKFPCKICNKAVANNLHAVQCTNCHLWVYIKCNRINVQTYKYLQKCSSARYYLKCYEELIPFTSISNTEFYQTSQRQNTKFTAITKNGFSKLSSYSST